MAESTGGRSKFGGELSKFKTNFTELGFDDVVFACSNIYVGYPGRHGLFQSLYSSYPGGRLFKHFEGNFNNQLLVELKLYGMRAEGILHLDHYTRKLTVITLDLIVTPDTDYIEVYHMVEQICGGLI